MLVSLDNIRRQRRALALERDRALFPLAFEPALTAERPIHVMDRRKIETGRAIIRKLPVT